VIGIGTSTGGPKALQELLPHIPATVRAPIFIVQHMPAGYTRSLATRLDYLSQIKVKEAEDNEVVENGVAYIAPGDFHLTICGKGDHLYTKLQQAPAIKGHRPSVDCLFDSISALNKVDVISVIMTGMGADGKNGLIQLKQKQNVKAIAESESSCIVYGMPKSAVATGLVDDEVELSSIPKTIMQYML
jgi:two-component system chemotaxis response regulator CheB